MNDINLTYSERLILSNQFEILKLLNPDQEHYYDQALEIVNSGLEYMYGEINPAVYKETTSAAISKEVVQILDMFRTLEFSCRKLGIKPTDIGADFQGFDANEGTGHYGFCHFMRRKLGRWDELKDYPDNSHSGASLPFYREMLKRLARRDKKSDLNEADIRAVVGR